MVNNIVGGVFMKNIYKKRVFYYALYGCLGVILLGTMALALYLTGNQGEEVTMVDALGTGNLVPPPILDVPPMAEVPQGQDEHAIREFFNLDRDGDPQESPLQEEAQPTQQPEEVPTPTPTPQPEQPQAEVTQVEEIIPVFNAFNEGNLMMWPVLGEIVMDYSSDQFIFDSTLNLYRTNDTINIASAVGSNVRAAAEGVVTSVFYERRDGNSITIDHGNGWETTYSQLGDIVVSEGDVVVAGQIIGQVGDPSIFTSSLGDNVGFRVSLNESTVNPLSVLPQ